MAKLSGEQWGVHIVSADEGSGRKFQSILARDSRAHYGVAMSTVGQKYLALFSQESCRSVAKSFLRQAGSRISVYDETDAVGEISNILVNSIAAAIAQYQGTSHLVAAPETSWGKKADLFEQAFGSAPDEASDMTSALIHICSPTLSSDCTLLIQLDRLSVVFLLNPPPVF